MYPKIDVDIKKKANNVKLLFLKTFMSLYYTWTFKISEFIIY